MRRDCLVHAIAAPLGAPQRYLLESVAELVHYGLRLDTCPLRSGAPPRHGSLFVRWTCSEGFDNDFVEGKIVLTPRYKWPGIIRIHVARTLKRMTHRTPI